MAQALGELRGPVNQEALRLRMAALHGREDALLDPARFPRLLRQANDAEIADVRKVGEDDYEISARRGGGVAPAPSAPAASPPPAGTGAGAERAGRGRRAGRRGPRPARGRTASGSACGSAAARAERCARGEIPLIGVVQMDAPAEAAPVAAVRSRPPSRPKRPARKPARPRARAAEEEGRDRHGGQGRQAGQGRGRPADDAGAAPAAPVKRGRSRAREEGGVKAQRRAATLPVSFFDRPADVVARELLGALVVSRLGGVRTSARIVETEAYLGYRDPASHGYLHRRNDRNAALFGPPGSWYVYLSYGIHWCANLVCEAEGTASAVLLRALEPVEGVETMRERRGRVDDRELCSGPGKLCQALGITRDLDGRMMPDAEVVVLPAARGPAVRGRHHAAHRHHQGGRLAAPVRGGGESARVGEAVAAGGCAMQGRAAG